MGKFALAAIAALLLAFPARAENMAQKAFPDIDMICQQWEDDNVLKDCRITVDKSHAATIGELRFQDLGDNDAGFLGFYGLETPFTKIGSIEYENVSGSPAGILAMLTNGESALDMMDSDSWKNMKAGKIRFSDVFVSDGNSAVFIRKGEAEDSAAFSSGPARLSGVEFRENGETIVSASGISFRSVSFSALEKLFPDKGDIADAMMREPMALAGASVKGMAIENVVIPEANASIGKILFDYDGSGGSSKGSLKVENAEMPGALLASFGLSGLPEKISASLDNDFEVTGGNGGMTLSQTARGSATGLLAFSAKISLLSGKGGFSLPSLLLSIEDKGLVKAIPLPVRTLAKTFLNSYIPGIQDTLDRFLKSPGQKFTLSRLENERDGVVVEVSETGPEDWI